MFTKEQKERAVKLYIESGQKATAVINALGYPSRNMLRYWYQEYINTGKIHHERPSKYKKVVRVEGNNNIGGRDVSRPRAHVAREPLI